MDIFVRNFLPTILLMTALIFIFLCCKPFLKKISPKWRYYSWLIIVIGLLIPFRPMIVQDQTLFQVEVSKEMHSFIFDMSDLNKSTGENSNQYPSMIFTPQQQQNISTWTTHNDSSAEGSTVFRMEESKSLVEKETSTISIWEQAKNIFLSLPWITILVTVWLAGIVLILTHNLMKHFKFKKMIKRWSAPVADNHIISLLKAVQYDLELSTYIRLEICEFIASPMMTGFKNPVLLIPSEDFSDEELTLIFRHECIHFKRKDLWYKLLVMLTTTIYWFYPPVYFMAKAINSECELSCDEETLKSQPLESRIRYGEIIISLLKSKSRYATPLTTYFYESKRNLKTRIRSITNTKILKRGLPILCLVLALTVCSGSVLAFSGNAQVNADMASSSMESLKKDIPSSMKRVSALEAARANNGPYLEQISISEFLKGDYDASKLSDAEKSILYSLNAKIDSDYTVEVIAYSSKTLKNQYRVDYQIILNPVSFDTLSVARLNQILTECAYSISYCAMVGSDNYFTKEDKLFNVETSFPQYYNKNWKHLNIFKEIKLSKLQKL